MAKVPPELIAQIPTLVNMLLIITDHVLADVETPEQYKAQLEEMWGGIQAMKARVAAVELPAPGSGA